MPLRKPTRSTNNSLKYSHWIKIIDNILLILSVILLALLFINLFNHNIYLKDYEVLFNILWISFSIEFIIKISLAKNKLTYLRKDIFLPIIILFPFLRPLSLLPISQFGLLVFADQIDDRFPIFRKWRILETILLLIVIIVIFSNIFLLVEAGPATKFKSFSDALWFSTVTLATIGYGDIYPKTLIGRFLAVLLMVFGISLFSAVIARISSVLVETEQKPLFAKEEKEINKMMGEEKVIEKITDKIEKEDKNIENRLEEIEEKLEKK